MESLATFNGALVWLQYYLVGRTQSVSWDSSLSISRKILSSVPHGSALSPLLFMLYVVDVRQINESFGLS